LNDRAKSDESCFGMVELLAWVAGLSAVWGLVAEVVRQANREGGVALVGGMLVVYVVYAAFSVRNFWMMPRVAIPTTMLIGGLLWTLSLQSIERSDLVRALIAALFTPLATAYAVRLIFPGQGEPENVAQGHASPSLVYSLRDKGTGFGSRSRPAG
jgi:hypothetical protein